MGFGGTAGIAVFLMAISDTCKTNCSLGHYHEDVFQKGTNK
jgi:hypothetical protein